MILIGGTRYAGETKKSVFTVMNYLMPLRNVLSMHCSANVGQAGDTAIFFGLSGTGKTTLSSDPHRPLIGDDEHGWSGDGVFNFEGGCYAKMIKLRQEAEPEIWAASHRFGTVLENVVVDPITRELDVDDASLTENTRSAYPISFVPNVVKSGMAGHPALHDVGHEADRIRGARVLGERGVVDVELARDRVDDDVLEDRAEAMRRGPDLRFRFLAQLDHLRVAPALEVEDAVARPAVLVVADQRPVRIRGERRLAGPGEAEEDRGVAGLPDVRRAVHREHVAQRHQVVHHGEHGLLGLAGVARRMILIGGTRY